MLELLGHSGRVRTLAYRPDGRFLVSGGDDRTVRLWDLTAARCVHSFTGHKDWVRAVAFVPGKVKIVSGAWDDSLLSWSIARPGSVKVVGKAYRGGVWSLDFNSEHLAVGTGAGNVTILPASLVNTRARTIQAHAWPVHALAWSPDGKTLATASHDRTIKLWDSDWFQCLATLTGHDSWLRSLAWSPDGQRLVTGGEDGRLSIWSTARDSIGRLAVLEGHTDRVDAVRFTADGQYLISASWDGIIRTWSGLEGRPLAERDWRIGRINALVLSPDGMTAAASGADGRILVWDTDGPGV